MSKNQNWSDKKPTEPGLYMTRWRTGYRKPRRLIDENRVEVTRRGKGLSVFCPSYNDRTAMSDIGDDELQWRKIE